MCLFEESLLETLKLWNAANFEVHSENQLSGLYSERSPPGLVSYCMLAETFKY